MEQLPEAQPIRYGQGDRLATEFGLGDLVLVELPQRHRRAVERGGDVLAAVQSNQRGVDRVLRPAEGAGAQRLADLRAALACADGSEHLLADGVLFGGIRVTQGLERVVGTVARALDDGFPSGEIGLLVAREE